MTARTNRSRAVSLALFSLMMVVSVPAPAGAAPVVTGIISVGDAPNSVAFSPNGKKAYVANYNEDTVSVITVATGEETSTITVGNGPTSVAFSPNGKKAYVANYNEDTVSVINVSTGTVQGDPIDVGDGPLSVAFSPNGKKAYVANQGGDTVSVITPG